MKQRHISVGLLGSLTIICASASALADAPPQASPPSPSPPAASATAPLNTLPPPPAPPQGMAVGAPGFSPPPPPPWAGPYPYPYGYPAYPSPPPKKVWYGWQTLIVLGGSSLLTAASVTPAVAVTLPLALTGFTFGGPIVHWSHGHVGKGFAVMGMNMGATVVGGLLGAFTVCSGGACSGDLGGLGYAVGFAVGGGVGLLTSNIIDVAVLSKEERAPEQVEAKGAGRRHVMVLPSADVRKDRAVFGVMGVF